MKCLDLFFNFKKSICFSPSLPNNIDADQIERSRGLFYLMTEQLLQSLSGLKFQEKSMSFGN